MTEDERRASMLAEMLVYPQFPRSARYDLEWQLEHADWLPDGWKHWLRWEQLNSVAGPPHWQQQSAGRMRNLKEDAGRTLGFARAVARKHTSTAGSDWPHKCSPVSLRDKENEIRASDRSGGLRQ
jgi:hypothetical protein